MARSPYDVLGVPRTATDDEVKKAYRKLARENHPDANQGDAAAEERFKEIQGAYAALEPEKRKQSTPGANGAWCRAGYPGRAVSPTRRRSPTRRGSSAASRPRRRPQGTTSPSAGRP
jgi:curved DNA-binding protein CbpA